MTTGIATVRCGMSGHAGANGGQIVLNKDSSVLDRAGNGQKKFSQSVHTQEVTGSSPVVSTKKFLISQEIRNFSSLCPYFVQCNFVAFRKTQTVTQITKYSDRFVQHRIGFPLSGAAFCPFFCFFRCRILGQIFVTSHMALSITFPMVSAASRFISGVAWV